ncbi:MAG: transcription antitermination factor NusB [Clostridia bacterium]|nr:transcription antitermination factor NusB [Clostridia bacterium]
MSEKMTRREAREAAFCLIFESDFRAEDVREELYSNALRNLEIPKNKYVKTVYFGVADNVVDIDALIAKCSVGWKTERMTHVSRAILRLAVYEMLFMEDIPVRVTINEALELAKKYDEEKARAFVNGVLNAVKDTLPAEADANA